MDSSPSGPCLCLVDPPSPATDRLARALEAEGYEVRLPAAEDRRTRGLDERVEVLLGTCGPASESLLVEALRLPEGPELILFEDFGEVAGAFEELRRAAFDTLARPVPDEEVLRVVRRALDHRALLADNRRLRGSLHGGFELGGLLSRDPRMGRIFETVEAVADSPVSLLIEGESGTGKTVLAHAIHQRSARSGGPFVAVNCGAIPHNLQESELFGHVRGAFTGAVKDREGKFEAASGGTLFLDELGTASHDLQVKLLRVLEEGRLERVGESRTRQVDVRVIAATNADLEREVEAGRFRADLFYRVHVVAIDIPPLRERVCDIPLLAERFLAAYCERHGRAGLTLTPAALQRLCSDRWPGNVRELENRIERAVLLARTSAVEPADLWPDEVPTPVEAPASSGAPPDLAQLPLGPLKSCLAPVERWLLVRALAAHQGNRQETARTLGMNRTTLFNKMRRHGL